MYGMVNKAVKDLITETFGPEQWATLADAVGVDHHFISMQAYDDEVTYQLVAEASNLVNVPQEELLRQFGSYWIRFTASEGYGHIIGMFGDTLGEFLEHLGNDLHARVALSMPDLKPPEFRTEKLDARTYRVHYSSHRAGLGPMVGGLLEGLSERFQEPATVTHRHSEAGAINRETFDVVIT